MVGRRTLNPVVKVRVLAPQLPRAPSVKGAASPADKGCMRGSRSIIGLCATVGLFAGGYVPMLWGASSFSMTSLLASAVGGIAGVWAGVRLLDF
jgi:hypothetical protein